MRVAAFACALVLAASVARASATHTLAGVEYVEAGPPDGPVVVALHWQGGDPRELLTLLSSRAPDLHFLAPSAGPSHSWYEGSSLAAANPTLIRSVARLTAFLVAVGERHGKPVVAGYSQGGILALALAASRPDLASAIVAVSGRLPASYYRRFADVASRPPEIVQLHGDADATISYASAKQTAAAFTAHGYAVELRAFPKEGHGLSSARIVAFVAALQRLAAPQKSGVASPPP